MSEVHQFASGAVRSRDADAYRYDLITPIGLRRLARRYKLGIEKGYGAFNWEKGMPIHDLLNHAIKHINDFLAGDAIDPDNLAGAAWNVMAAMHSEEMWPHLNEGHQRGPGCVPPTPKVDAQIGNEFANLANLCGYEKPCPLCRVETPGYQATSDYLNEPLPYATITENS